MASIATDTSIPEHTRYRAMMREGSTKLRLAIYDHFGIALPEVTREIREIHRRVPPVRMERQAPLFGRLLISVVAEAYAVEPETLFGPSRASPLVEARALVSDTLRHRGWSYPTIALLLRRDHSSIINQVENVDVYRKRSALCREVYEMLEPYRNREANDTV